MPFDPFADWQGKPDYKVDSNPGQDNRTASPFGKFKAPDLGAERNPQHGSAHLI